MKKITLLLLMFSSITFSQTNPIDFEAGGNGASWTWNVFENVDNPPLEFVANPNTTGNTSATVAKFTARNGGQTFAGTVTNGQGTFTLTNANSTVKIMVYKTVISDVGIKFETGSGASTGEIKVANTKVNEWEELIFDMSAKIGEPSSTDITGLVVFPDFATRAQDNIIYFDNITFEPQSAAPSEPTTGAPAPSQTSNNVISLFSDAYTDVAVDNFNAFSNGGATLEDVMIDGNPTKKYSNLDFVGIETKGANLIDASSMTTFHIDIWTPDANNFKIKIVDFGADENFQGGDDSEHEVVYASTETGKWISYDIPLTNFTGLNATTNLAQFILSKNPSGTIFVDNIYFHNDAVAVTAPQTSAPIPTAQESDVLSMYSDSYSNNKVTNFNLNAFQGGGTVISETDIDSNGNQTLKIENLTFYGAQWDAVDVSSSTKFKFVHLDYFATTSTAFNFYLVDETAAIPGGNSAEPRYAFASSGGDETLVQGEWKSIFIPLEHFTNYNSGSFSYDLNDIFQWKFDGNGTVFIDNVYFSAVNTLSSPSFELTNVSLFPNPAENILKILAENTIHKAVIYNVIGKEVKSIIINDTSKNIDISDLNSGIYLIKYTINNAVGTSKFIKN